MVLIRLLSVLCLLPVFIRLLIIVCLPLACRLLPILIRLPAVRAKYPADAADRMNEPGIPSAVDFFRSLLIYTSILLEFPEYS